MLLLFVCGGKVTESDVSLILSDAKEKINHYGDIVFLEVVESFEGIEIAALIEEFKYLFEVGISNISKVALVTDKDMDERNCQHQRQDI